MRDDRRALITVSVWLAGAAWILIPHRFEGPVIFVISQTQGWGVHRNDIVGVVVPVAVTVFLRRRHLGRWLHRLLKDSHHGSPGR